MTLTRYEIAVKLIRERGPMTTARLGKTLGWSRQIAASAISAGRKNKLLVPDPINRKPFSRRLYHAAVVPGWPLPAPDTLFPHERAPA